jgi:alpha-L-fucosidase
MHDTIKGGQAFHEKNYGLDFEYRNFAPLFKAELWEPDYWAKLFKRSGAKYVVLTSKHHDGFCLFDAESPYSKNWNSIDVGPKRDLLKELSTSVRNEGLKMGIYYSLMEWESISRNQGYYLPDSIIEKYKIDDPDYVNNHMIPQLKQLVLDYQPAVIFSDGEWDKPDEYWHSKDFLSWLYNNAPNKEEIVVNDRWGSDTRGKHGGYYTSEYSSDSEAMSANHPWEESRGMGQSYGFNRAENIDDYNSSEELIYELISIVSRGGNLLLNIGPTADGRIPVIMQQRLVDIGKWLDVNGDAIYGSEAWENAPESENYFFTKKGTSLYLITKSWPGKSFTVKGNFNNIVKCTLLGTSGQIKVKQNKSQIIFDISEEVMNHRICEPAYVFKLN